eukprot:8324524-Pyramimonas_sp.AAC.1
MGGGGDRRAAQIPAPAETFAIMGRYVSKYAHFVQVPLITLQAEYLTNSMVIMRILMIVCRA